MRLEDTYEYWKGMESGINYALNEMRFGDFKDTKGVIEELHRAAEECKQTARDCRREIDRG